METEAGERVCAGDTVLCENESVFRVGEGVGKGGYLSSPRLSFQAQNHRRI